MSCKKDRAQQNCPQCVSHDANRNHQNLNTGEKLSHRSITNCSFKKIGPIVEEHYSPIPMDRLARKEAAMHSCSQVQQIAVQRANEARRSHRRFDLRKFSPINEDNRVVDQISQALKDSHMRRGSSSSFRLQPSQQATPQLSARYLKPNTQAAPQSSARYANLQEYVLIENGRHGSCAIQQPCNFCGNQDCFSPINGTHTCCFELLHDRYQAQKTYEDNKLSFLKGKEPSTVLEDNSVEVIPEENFLFLRQKEAIQQEPISKLLVKKAKKPAPKLTAQAGVQTSPRVMQSEKQVSTVQVQTVKMQKNQVEKIVTKPLKVSKSTSTYTPPEQTKGSNELQKSIAMLNKLCVFHLNRATQHGQTLQQTRVQLERNILLFEQCLYILNYLKQEFQETAEIRGDGTANRTKEITSRTQQLNEDHIYLKIKLRCDACLVSNVALFKFFKLPAKLEGNLLLITHLLDNTLQAIFERLKKVELPEIQIPSLRTALEGQCFEDLWKDSSQYRNRTLTTSYEAPEPEVELVDSFVIEEQVFSAGFADVCPDQIQRKSRNTGRSDRKAELSCFDRDKFYRRIGIDPNQQELEESQKEGDDECLDRQEDDIELVEGEDEEFVMDMVAEVCQTEFGSVGLADKEEITIEKSFEQKPQKKADLRTFDLQAFYRKQGVYDEPLEEKIVFAQRQMTTQEFDMELADHIPVQLQKTCNPKQRERAPDLVDREAFYKRLGIDLHSDKISDQFCQSDFPTEKKSYMVPALEPMMQTWTYAAEFRQERISSPEDIEVSDDDFEDENVEAYDQERAITKTVQKSMLAQKLQLHDYVFDECQNIEADLGKIALKDVIRQADKNQKMLHSIPKNERPQKVQDREVIGRKILDSPDKANYDGLRCEEVDFDSPTSNEQPTVFKSAREASIRSPTGKNGHLSFIISPTSIPPVAVDSEPYQPHRSVLKKGSTFLKFQSHAQPNQNLTMFSTGVNQNRIPKAFDHNKTPKAFKAQIQFPDSAYQESSAPTLKLYKNCGNLSERLQYNKDPRSMNRNNITIDDEGNINIGGSPSPQPSPIKRRESCREEEDVDEAKTFVSSHLFFSHLMSFDGQKNTLVGLNSASHVSLVQKGMQVQAREQRDQFVGGTNSYISPNRSRVDSRGARPIGSTLSRILSGVHRSRKSTPSRQSFVSGAGGEYMHQSMDQTQPHITIKQAQLIGKSNVFRQNISPSISTNHEQFKAASFQQQRINSSERKQQTFYPKQLHQIIPEQLNEDTNRNLPVQMKTANFKYEANSSTDSDVEDSRHSSMVVVIKNETIAEDERNNVPVTIEVDNRTSSVSLGNFNRYLKTGSRENPSLPAKYFGNQVLSSESYYRLPQSRQSNKSNSRERSAYYPYQPANNESVMRPGSQHLGANLSRQTNDLLRSELGRSCLGENSMMIYRRKKQNFKGPQSSDIVPVFRLTKAQPIETHGVLKTAYNQVSQYTRNVEEIHQKPVAETESIQRQIHFSKSSKKRPESQKGMALSLIKVEDYD